MSHTPHELLSDAEDAEREAGYVRDTFLRVSGWTYTCQTPGCYWMWQKALPDGRTLLVDAARAMTLEQHLMPEPPTVDGGEKQP